MWTNEDTELFQEEVERRFRSRTPPKHMDEVQPEGRVTRSEMRSWALEVLKKPVPELDLEWLKAHARWYKRMAKRVEAELL